MPDLSKIGERERLKPKPKSEPYWQKLRLHCSLGYCPSKRGGRGTWFARFNDAENGKLLRKNLGTYAAFHGHDVFKEARRDAEKWFELIENGGTLPIALETVEDACREYAKTKANEAGTLRRTVYSDPIAKIKLQNLRRHHLLAWRKRLEDTPALISRSPRMPVRTKVRSKSTINRDMVPLRAALARVLNEGPPSSDAAWQEALRPYKGADQRRRIYLDREDRRSLLKALNGVSEPFFRALCYVPLRPKAMADLNANDFDPKTRTLRIGTDKNGMPREIALPHEISDFFASQIRMKLPHAPIFSRENGKRWNKDAWKYPIKEAVKETGLPIGVSAYTLRHSAIIDLIRGGLPILTVAQMSGTSVAMIEKHYGHLVREDAVQALEKLIL